MQRGAGPSFMNAAFPPACLILAWVVLGSLGHAYRATLLGTSDCRTTRIRKLQVAAVAPAPALALPAPPPNSDCHQICGDGITALPSSTPCGCIIPIRLGLELGISLDILLEMTIELAKELADGSFLLQSQVRITGANPVPTDPDKTDVTADLVPLGVAFDNTTAELIAERFWTRQVFINESLFGVYSVLYVRYPFLRAVPPAQASDGSVGGVPTKDVGPGDANGGDGKGRDRVLRRGMLALIVLSSGFGLVVVLGAISVVFAGWNSKGLDVSMVFNPPPLNSYGESGEGSMVSSLIGNSTSMSFISSIAAYTGFVRTFTALELEIATQRFSLENVLGEGGFGRVYRGILEDSSKVAVKVLTGNNGNEFIAEVELLSRLHHRNLVKLIGVCTEGQLRSLIYELVSNGSLEYHLHDVDKLTPPLDWGTRIKIALGAARGLAYLHEDSNPRVIHRDFKSSNILLEDDWTPKVSDFGLAKVATEGGTEHVSTRVMGTFGYVAPEYAMTGHLLVKSDVYSYGVVLLELLTGRQPVDMDQPSGQENLVTWARALLTNRETVAMCIDPALGDNYPVEDMEKVCGLAYRCVHPEVSQRPFMGEVVQALKLVYHESDVSEGNGSAAASQGVSPVNLQLSNNLSSLSSDRWGGHSQYAPDGWHPRNEY